MNRLVQVILLLLLFSCQNELTDIEEIRNDSQSLVNDIIQRDRKSFERQLSMDNRRKKALYDDLVNIFYSVQKIDFQIKDESYFSSIRNGDTLVASFNRGERDEYLISYCASSGKVLFNSIILKTSNGEEFFLGLFREKENKKWTITDYVIRPLKLDGRTKSQHLSIAKTVTENGYILKGIHHLNMSYAFNSVYEKASLVKFESESNERAIIESIKSKIDSLFKFPLDIELTNSSIKLYDIVSAKYSEDQSYYPVLLYKSNIMLSNNEKLRAENIELHNSLSNYFKGADELDTLLYRVYNEIPTPSNSNNIGFIRSIIDLE